jgi:hypothetical protein
MILVVRKGRLCLQVEESTVWSQASPESLVLKVGKVFTVARVQERKYKQ